MKLPDDFGCLVFDEDVMRKRLPENICCKLKHSIQENFTLDDETCNIIANDMKNWAIEHGATHFTHWFHPLIGISAEKHESFISKNEHGNIIMNFSGKELAKGEADSSSFSSGGLCSTFSAHGHTFWNAASNAFIRGKTLYIPAVFYSHNGEILDDRIPLFKSMKLLNKHALRIFKLFDNVYVKQVFPTVGVEQEYFLIDKKFLKCREDLKLCGRTLFGTTSNKMQEEVKHYLSPIKPRILAYMNELDEELWKLGILSKIKHSEVSPAQYELVSHFSLANIAADQNQLIMEIMQNIAERHGLYCLLHEKPFFGFNGSGKHINWSLATDTGKNLFEPGYTSLKNAQFLLFLCALIKGVDEYQDLLCASAASAGNDLRLGGNEAPCTIMSIFLGEELTEILYSIEKSIDHSEKICINSKFNINIFQKLKSDNLNRNRTSPFAFTGNKFEFRMVGSSMSIAYPITVINTIMANELCQFADILENGSNFDKDLTEIIVNTIKNHKKIIFNGNNYSDEWHLEAKKRHLFNFKTSANAISQLIATKNIEIFEKYKILTKVEISAIYNVLMQNYCQTLHTEVMVMDSMIKKQIIPSTEKYIKVLCDTVLSKKQITAQIDCSAEIQLISLLSTLLSELYNNTDILKENLITSNKIPNLFERSKFYYKKIFSVLNKIRKSADKIEQNIDKKLWPFPSYSDILFEF